MIKKISNDISLLQKSPAGKMMIGNSQMGWGGEQHRGNFITHSDKNTLKQKYTQRWRGRSV
jgi:hypothetical protein